MYTEMLWGRCRTRKRDTEEKRDCFIWSDVPVLRFPPCCILCSNLLPHRTRPWEDGPGITFFIKVSFCLNSEDCWLTHKGLSSWCQSYQFLSIRRIRLVKTCQSACPNCTRTSAKVPYQGYKEIICHIKALMGFPFLSMQTSQETLFEHVICCVEFWYVGKKKYG